MDRRNFIKTAGLSLASVLISDSLFAWINHDQTQLINFPDEVTAIVYNESVKLTGKGNQTWTYDDIIVELIKNVNTIGVEIQSPYTKLSSVTLHWKIPNKNSLKILNDHWERSYGDGSWHKPTEKEILPWYFMEYNGTNTNGFGVKTGCSAFCFWQIENKKLSLTLDTMSGGIGVKLGDRKLKAAEIVTIKSKHGESPFSTTRRFTKLMCDKARMPKEPVYGINDWYFSYGNNSAKLITEHTELMAPMADGLSNRPFSVIDAGWFMGPLYAPDDCCWADDLRTPKAKFGKMPDLVEKIKQLGMRPGIWTRPLCGSHDDFSDLMLPLISGREINKPVLDPTIHVNLERIKSYFKLYQQWGFELVKFDFTTFDILGRWGFEMIRDRSMTQPNWNMNDKSKTNAEIILNLYKVIREAAGDTYLIGCNTISHLSAGLFELNRIGDDTSGNEWDRTRKMGVNTLAFRGLQHGTFYAADSDCVGLTNKIPWDKNKQWLNLLAKSGTPLFISAQTDAIGAEQKAEIKKCFQLASQNLPLGEPLDWMENAFPKKWKLHGSVENFNWD
jgi:alpha-galactosidase